MRAEITQAISAAALEIFRATEQERRSPVEIVNILQVHLGPVINDIDAERIHQEADALHYENEVDVLKKRIKELERRLCAYIPNSQK